MAATLTPAAIAQQRHGESWLITIGAHPFWPQFEQFHAQFKALQPRDILLVDSDPVRFLAAFFAALQHPCRIWLANPQWGTQEWHQVTAQCQPDIVIGTVPPTIRVRNRAQGAECEEMGLARGQDTRTKQTNSPAPQPPNHPTPSIHIPTGGSSGNIRFAVHTWETLLASVQGFCQHFDCATVNAYCILPLHHVSGLMQAMRCWLTGGQLTVQPFQELLQPGAISQTFQQERIAASSGSFLSLVPTQLQRSLQANWDTVPWLRQFTAILLGGAPLWPSLRQTARDLRLPLAPTYGLTETAAQVATLLPSEFLAGQTGSGRALPHAQITIQDGAGQALPPGVVGQIAIKAKSLARASGLTPIAPPLMTNDLGCLDQAGFLHVMGRETSLIITGGEKVQPEEVEAAILATGLVQDVAVVGLPDADWGERVVAIAVGTAKNDHDTLAQTLRQRLKFQLSPYKLPKQWCFWPTLPRNAQGKLNRSLLLQQVAAALGVPSPAPTRLARRSGAGADGSSY
ncbi:MAG: AMP-binding protein [Cyanobacteria bacterium P01_D01_bin.71]